jgi:hypothetical protein
LWEFALYEFREKFICLIVGFNKAS